MVAQHLQSPRKIAAPCVAPIHNELDRPFSDLPIVLRSACFQSAQIIGVLQVDHEERGQLTGRPSASPNGAPDRSEIHARTAASTSGSDASGCSRRNRSATIRAPNSANANATSRGWSGRSFTLCMLPASTRPKIGPVPPMFGRDE